MINWKDSYFVGYKNLMTNTINLFPILTILNSLSKTRNFIKTFFQGIKYDFREITKLYRFSHFKSDKDMFKTNKYPHEKEHIESHAVFVDNVKVLIVEFEDGTADKNVTFKIYNILINWLIHHILNTDKMYIDLLE